MSEWQPIETAPKDGTVVLVNDYEAQEGAAYVMAYWQSGSDWSGWAYEDEMLNDAQPLGPSPTHWFLIPPPPSL
jgi:hypothetical protein